MTKQKDLISIVIPVYKVEEYIDRCIQSIINQSYKKLEILLVDDGSPDDCGKICDKYALKDERIKVIHKENGGLSDARNFGINASNGHYICFVDSDDFVHKDYIKNLYENAIKNKADICACNFEYINDVGKKWIRKEKINKVYSKEEAIKDIFSIEQNTEVMVWNKIYKKKLFTDNKIEFPVGKIHEDNFTTYKLYDKANKIVLINDKLYYYLQRDNSIMSVFNEKRFDILVAVDEVKEYFKDRKEFKDITECYELLVYLALLNNMIKSKYEGKEKKSIANKIIKKRKRYLKNKIIPTQKKLMIIMLSININLYSYIFRRLKK